VSATNVLVAGIGNVFLGDDGFGVEVVRRMAVRALPARVVDFGIRGFDLACALLEPLDLVVLVDAVRRGGAPGTLYLMEVDPATEGRVDLQGHSMDPAQVIRNARAMGGRIQARVLLVGCEPASFGDPETGAMGLSGCVDEAVGRAIEMIEQVVAEREAHA
jgi:hydrogenase maturation protease